MINRAFEGADAFKKMMEEIACKPSQNNTGQADNFDNSDDRRYSVSEQTTDKMPDENRAQYRARMKQLRRSKAKV